MHKYRESSRVFFDQGGFDVHLEVRWSAQASIAVTTDGTVVQAESLSLPEGRVANYDTLVQVRESQPVLVASR